jgi:hypothetical protein
MLSSRWILNLLLMLAIAALVLAGLYLGEPQDGDRDPVISDLKPADVSRIEIRAGDSNLRLIRGAEGWSVQSPVDWAAHDANVGRLLSVLKASASPIADAADVDLEPLGLESPGASLRFNDTELRFGGSNNIGERRYVMLDSKLYLLPDVYLAFAAQGLAGLADRRLLPRRYSLESLQLPGVTISRQDDDSWRAEPAAGHSQQQLSRLADNWQELQASRVKNHEGPRDQGRPIVARLQDGRSIEFRLLSVTPEIVIANPQIGLQYHFRADFHDQLVSPGQAGDAG